MKKDAATNAGQPTEIVPQQRNPEHESIIDFAHLSPEELASYLLAEIRHPSLHNLDSERLSDLMSTRLLVNNADPSSLGTNIHKFIDSSKIFISPDIFDQKVAHDEIFAYLTRALQASRGNMDRSTQRKVIMSLLSFRGSFSVDATSEDSEWKELVVRLLS